MEPPCSSFHPENGLKVGLPIIHPEFCKRLLCYDLKRPIVSDDEDGWQTLPIHAETQGVVAGGALLYCP